jgi:hypothetical protein
VHTSAAGRAADTHGQNKEYKAFDERSICRWPTGRRCGSDSTLEVDKESVKVRLLTKLSSARWR